MAENYPIEPAEFAIPAQFEAALVAFDAAAAILYKRRLLIGGARLPSITAIRLQFAEKKAEWAANGTYRYIDGQCKYEGYGFTLAITPNIPVGSGKIADLATSLAIDLASNPGDIRYRSKPTVGMDHALYEQYSAEELSGVNGTDPVRFTLLTDHRGRFMMEPEAESARQGGVPMHYPSVLEALMVWYSRRQQGVLGVDGISLREDHGIGGGGMPSSGDHTGVYHLGLQPKPDAGGGLEVPWTYLQPPFDVPMLAGMQEQLKPVRLAVG